MVEYGNEWEQWCKFVDEWLKIKEIKIARSAIIYFMEKFLINHQYSNVDLFFNDLTKYEDYKNNLKIILDDKADNLSRIYHRYICELNSWIFHKYYSSLRYETLEPPFGRVTRVIRKDAENFEWFISTYGDEWSEWANLAYEWINSIDKGKDTRITSISNFFEYYLITFPSGSKVESFFCGLDGLNPSAEEFKEKVFNFLQTETKYITVYRHCVRFFDWILNKKFNVNGFNNFINPFGELKVLDGRSDDVKFSWLTEQYGVQWEQWRYLANEWILGFKGGLSQRMRALAIFLENYLAINNSEIYDVERFFNIDDAWNPTSVDLKKCIIKSTKISIESDIHQNINYIVEFIDWVLINHLCYENDFGYMVPMYQNPLERKNTFRNLNETVYSPLPYKYICNLRKKICPNEFGSFTDWEWAQNTTNKIYGGSWFDVDENIINFNDKDCVWRKVLYTKAGKKDHKYQLWSPVAAVALFVKLNLPLRTYQVRMLDSGEGDIERFENNLWNKNNAPLSKFRLNQGVFKKIIDLYSDDISTGFYINTNKTADMRKNKGKSGYTIPWENRVVLFWLEKLRNWQEKYNPIQEPTPCKSLEIKHIGQKKSEYALEKMGDICFLFRHAAADNLEDRKKPIFDSTLNTLWTKLLKDFEEDLYSSGHTFKDGKKINFVEVIQTEDRFRLKVLFPLHSLRVSLITSYLMEGNIPLPIISKLLAGHSSLLMTMYYAKLTPTVMQEKISEAEELIEASSDKNLALFLRDHEIKDIVESTAFRDTNAISAILKVKNPLSWELKSYGICLAAGNRIPTTEGIENRNIAGCWNGGDLIDDYEKLGTKNYQQVPHGAENCVRCRWFITNAHYLPQLVAHFNILSYKATLCAQAARKASDKIKLLEEEQYNCEKNGITFNKFNELDRLMVENKTELCEADEYCKDIVATIDLINKITKIEKSRGSEDQSQKIVSVGSEADIRFVFEETYSELLQLCLICDDAEIYPELKNQINKTPAIEKRTRLLSQILMKKGFFPNILDLDEDQQLYTINEILRNMVKLTDKQSKVESYRAVIDQLESNSFEIENFFFPDTKNIVDTVLKVEFNVEEDV